jgi:hypothetical protein
LIEHARAAAARAMRSAVLVTMATTAALVPESLAGVAALAATGKFEHWMDALSLLKI